jgi:hypothetical protein
VVCFTQVLEKDASYKAQIEKMGHKLEKSGFSQEVSRCSAGGHII